MTTTFDTKSTEIGPPLHYWKFESSDPDSEDDVGSDPDTDFNNTGAGTYTARVTGPLTDGTVNYGVQFTDGILKRTGLSSNDFASTTTGSISFWFKSSSATNQLIWSAHPDNNAFNFWLLADGTLQFQVIGGSNATTITTDDGDLDDGVWHFVALTCNGSSANTLYVDGAAVTVTQTTAGSGLGNHPWIGSMLSTGSQFWVGNSTRTSTVDQPFVGSFSRLAFWAGALSEDDVLALWNASTGFEAVIPESTKTYLNLDLPMTNSAYMAQRLAYRKLLAQQRPKMLVLPMSLRAIRHAVGDVVTVTVDDLSIDAQTFRVVGWRIQDDGATVEVSLKEDSEQAYLDPSVGTYKQQGAASTVTEGTVQVPPPTALAAAAALEGIQLTWTAPDNLLGVHHYAIYSDTDSSWSGATLIGTTLSTSFLHTLSATATRYYWVRSVDASGTESIRSPDSDTSTVTATYTAGTIATPSAAQTLGGIDGTPTTGQLTGVFKRAGVTIASKVFTATHSGGNLTVTAGSDTGEATTYSLSGDGTPTVVVTQTHTGSGTVNGTMTFTVAP